MGSFIQAERERKAKKERKREKQLERKNNTRSLVKLILRKLGESFQVIIYTSEKMIHQSLIIQLEKEDC